MKTIHNSMRKAERVGRVFANGGQPIWVGIGPGHWDGWLRATYAELLHMRLVEITNRKMEDWRAA